jgi:hypothetical protein
MIRLAMYHALARWDNLPPKCSRHISKEINKFVKQIDDQLIVLKLMSQAKDKAEEKEEGDII